MTTPSSPTTMTGREDEEPREGLPRALYLIENFLWNEDGAEDAWLLSARDLVKVAVNDYDRLRAIEEAARTWDEAMEDVAVYRENVQAEFSETGGDISDDARADLLFRDLITAETALRSALAAKLREEG